MADDLSVSLAESDEVIAKDTTQATSFPKDVFPSPMRTSLVLTLSFVAVFSALQTLQNLQSSLNPERGLGVTSVACIYAMIILSGVLSPALIDLLGAKRILVVTWLCHVVYTLTNFHPAWWTLVPSSLLLGSVSGALWTSQGLYLSGLGSALAGRRSITLQAAMSQVSGLFFSLFATTFITGNLLSSFLLNSDATRPRGDNSTLPECGAALCPDLAGGSGGANQTAILLPRPERHLVYAMLGAFLACQGVGLLLTLVGIPPLPRAPSGGGGDSMAKVLRSLTACCWALRQPRLLLVLPLFMAHAQDTSLFFSGYTQAFITCSVGVWGVGYAMAAYGAVFALTSVGVGRTAKRMGRGPLLATGCLVELAVLTTMLLWTPQPGHLAPLFILPCLRGFGESFLQTQFLALLSVVFSETKTESLAVFHSSRAVGYMLGYSLGAFLCLSTRLYLNLALLSLGILGYASLEVSVRRDICRGSAKARGQGEGVL